MVIPAAVSGFRFELLLFLACAVVVAGVFLYYFLGAAPTWLLAKKSGVSLPFMQIIGMKLRKTSARAIAEALIAARKADVHVTVDRLEEHYLGGGNVMDVVDAFITANRAGKNVDIEEICAKDLARRGAMTPHDRMGKLNM